MPEVKIAQWWCYVCKDSHLIEIVSVACFSGDVLEEKKFRPSMKRSICMQWLSMLVRDLHFPLAVMLPLVIHVKNVVKNV